MLSSGATERILLSAPASTLAGVLRSIYRVATGAGVLAALPNARRDGKVAVFYGGARAGSSGGPLVKVEQLQRQFPEHRTQFSLVYLLSNALYLPNHVLASVQRAHVPIVVNQNGVFYPAWYPEGWERENARIGAALSRANYVLFQSEFCRRCAERFTDARPSVWEILPNAVDTAVFTPREASQPAGRPFRFLLTGKIVASTAYRVTSAITGLACARRDGLDVVLNVAGEMSAAVAADARCLAEQLGIADAVTFLGPFDRRTAPSIYRAADAYIMTKHNDPCPNVVLEALASGLPVLYSASGGVPELVGPEAGVGLDVPDTFEANPSPAPQAIAEGMARIIVARRALADAARRRAVEQFELSRWLGRHREIFNRLVSEAIA
jgi:glycosyltransferase involved in cell wall biosynthesis